MDNTQASGRSNQFLCEIQVRPKPFVRDAGHLKIAGRAPTTTSNREGVNNINPDSAQTTNDRPLKPRHFCVVEIHNFSSGCAVTNRLTLLREYHYTKPEKIQICFVVCSWLA